MQSMMVIEAALMDEVAAKDEEIVIATVVRLRCPDRFGDMFMTEAEVQWNPEGKISWLHQC